MTLVFRPAILPPVLRLGSLTRPLTVLLMGTDVVYTRDNRRVIADKASHTGRSDTMLVARLDPIRNTISILSIPRDTEVHIAGHGTQKINVANALGGPIMAKEVVGSLLGWPVDRYVVLNLKGLVELVDELGGITVEIPKRMHYTDWTAKLKINLEPGWHTLTGNQSMGFVRFRHDALGDIGRVQRQEIFLRAVLDRALKPESWGHIPKLVEIGRNYISTDLTDSELLSIITFVRAVPRANQKLVMLPGRFSGTGNWLADELDIRDTVGKVFGAIVPTSTKAEVQIAIENASSSPDLGRKLAKLLRAKGYEVIGVRTSPQGNDRLVRSTKIIAQRANPEDAEMVKLDLGNRGEIVNASIGDLESTVTVVAGEDLLGEPTITKTKREP